MLHKRPPPSSLMGITPLASILSQIVLVIVTQVFALVTLWGQKWCVPIFPTLVQCLPRVSDRHVYRVQKSGPTISA